MKSRAETHLPVHRRHKTHNRGYIHYALAEKQKNTAVDRELELMGVAVINPSA